MKFYETKEKFFEDIGIEWETFNIEDFKCSFLGKERGKYLMTDDDGVIYYISEKYANENGLLKKAKKKDVKK